MSIYQRNQSNRTPSHEQTSSTTSSGISGEITSGQITLHLYAPQPPLEVQEPTIPSTNAQQINHPIPHGHPPQNTTTSLTVPGDTVKNFTHNLRLRNAHTKNILLVHCSQINSKTLRLLKLLRVIVLPQEDCRSMRITFDFEMSPRCSALLLPLSLHSTQREYIRRRMQLYLRSSHELKYLIVLCDHPTPDHFLTELNMLALQNNITLILTFSDNEVARYLEAFTTLEALTNCGTTNLQIYDAVRHVSSTASGSQVGVVTDVERVENIFRSIPTISTTIMVNIIQHFKSLRNLSTNLYQVDQALGVGEVRANLIQQALRQPFSKVKAHQQQSLGVKPSSTRVMIDYNSNHTAFTHQQSHEVAPSLLKEGQQQQRDIHQSSSTSSSKN